MRLFFFGKPLKGQLCLRQPGLRLQLAHPCGALVEEILLFGFSWEKLHQPGRFRLMGSTIEKSQTYPGSEQELLSKGPETGLSIRRAPKKENPVGKIVVTLFGIVGVTHHHVSQGTKTPCKEVT